jgi:uncharacterized protein YabE (DUF348 family)
VSGQFETWSTVVEFLSGRPARAAAGAVLLGAVVGAAAAYAHSGTTVTLLVDGQRRTVDSGADTVQALLADQQIGVTARDIVAPGLSTPLREGEQVVVRYARPFTVSVDGVSHTYWTTQLTVNDALGALGIRADGARLSASRSMPLGRQGLDLAISTPKTVIITADGKRRSVTTTAATVGDLLAEQGVTVDADDKLSVAAAARVSDDLVVTLTRISHTRRSVVEAVPFPTTRETTAALFVGETKVVNPGRPGVRRALYDLLVANGKPAGKTLVSSTVTAEPVPRVVRVGTKKKPAPTTASGGGGSVGGGADGLNWAALARCESGGNPRAVNPAGYYGLYQFSLSTWASVGGSGSPLNASAAEQTYRAKLLYKRGGAGQWGCGAHLFDK